jgi:hypothetical protein
VTDSLKKANYPWLLLVLAYNLAILEVAIRSNALFADGWIALTRDWTNALPGALGVLFVGLLNSQLSADAKARLVFWRWSNPLPGSEAFTRWAPADSRVDLATLERTHGELPTDPVEQNRLWYKIYKSVDDDPSVVQAHREFLLYRDYACLALLAVPILGVVGLHLIPSTNTALPYLALLVGQCLLAIRAGRTNGRRLVTNVLALKGAGD